jgi:glycosyltransferase involved in cell wall biosynthesis
VEKTEVAEILGIIPAYNESKRITPVVSGALTHLPVLVVDDGSSDETAQMAEIIGAEVLQLSPNRGKGAALKSGFQQAIIEGFEAVLTLDADGQHDPAEIPKFVAAYKRSNADLIIGERDFSQIPLVRRLANTIGKWSFSWAVGEQIRDNQSGYRLISKRIMEAMLESEESGFEFEVEMIVICILQGYHLDWVPIRTIYTGEGSHIHPMKHIIEFSRMILQTRKKIASH